MDSIHLTPEFETALAELHELDRLQADYPFVAIEFSRLTDEGTPFLRANIDWRLGACLAACRIRANHVEPSSLEVPVATLKPPPHRTA
jgi:hypothetical protein